MAGLCGQNLIFNTLNSSLSYFLQFTLMIPAMAVSTILTSNQILDAIKGPFMGSIMDKTRTKWGKARPYLIFTPLPVGVLTVACFANRIYNVSAGMSSTHNLSVILLAFFSYFLWCLFFTAGDIPINGLPNLMTENEGDRVRLLSLKPLSYVCGGLAVLLVQPLSLECARRFFANSQSERQGEVFGFLLVVGFFSLIATALHQLASLAREHVSIPEKTYSLKENFQVMWRNKPFRCLLFSGLLGSPRGVTSITTVPLVNYYYANKNPASVIFYTAVLGAGSTIGQILSAPLAPRLIARFGKIKLYKLCNIISGITLISLFLIYITFPLRMAEPFFLFLCAFGLSVFSTLYSITEIISSLLTANAVDYEEYYNHTRTDGVFFSGRIITAKFSGGISSLIIGVAYALAGFSDSAVGSVNLFISSGGIVRTNPAFAPYMNVLFFLMLVPAAAGSLLSVLPMLKYPLSEKEHEAILESLSARRRGDSTTF